MGPTEKKRTSLEAPPGNGTLVTGAPDSNVALHGRSRGTVKQQESVEHLRENMQQKGEGGDSTSPRQLHWGRQGADE